MKLTRSRITEIAVVLLVISYPVISEVIYYRGISPGDEKHFSEFSDMISQESSVQVFETSDGTLLQFRGLLPRPGLLAVPSSAPIYYFNEAGGFVGWVQDPGDMKIPERFQAIGEGKLISLDEARRRILPQDTQSHNMTADSTAYSRESP
jgi:hypothetical protein